MLPSLDSHPRRMAYRSTRDSVPAEIEHRCRGLQARNPLILLNELPSDLADRRFGPPRKQVFGGVVEGRIDRTPKPAM
jgi:hypothetical protein